jgi:hypothetical protein
MPVASNLRAKSDAAKEQATASGTPPALFLQPPQYPTAGNSQSVVVADLNGDGKPDLVVADGCVQFVVITCTAGSVSVLLGNGDGTFQAHVDYATGPSANAVAVGDFNGDGKLDLVVSDGCAEITFNGCADTSGSVSVLLGNGDGTFQAAVNYATAPSALAVVVGDFNGDGKPDLAVAVQCLNAVNLGGCVSVLLGHGDGTFQSHSDYRAVLAAATSIAVGDFNGDGKQDLVLTGESVAVLLGNGDGTFQTEVSYDTGGTDPRYVSALDLNADGKLDLVVVNNDTASVSLLLGNGDGTFKTHVDYPVANLPHSLAVGDFNGDGKADLAVGGSGSVSLLFGNGDGTFQAHVDFQGGVSVAEGDFNGDGKADLALAGGGPISVLLGRGNGTFPANRVYGSGPSLNAVTAGDFNGDGALDLATTTGVMLGNGDGTFQNQINFPNGGTVTAVAVGDFNGDGKMDLATVISTALDSVTGSVLLGNGDGTFRVGSDYTTTGSFAFWVAEGDFNGDGKADLAVAYQCIEQYKPFQYCTNFPSASVLLGNGDGTLRAFGTYGTSQMGGGAQPEAVSVAVADLNSDGKPDLVVVNNYDPANTVLLGNGDGTFQPQAGTGAEIYGTSVAVADFNFDGKPDLVVADSYTVNVYLGNGDGTFQGSEYTAGNSPQSVAIGDFNGDGNPDFAVANFSDGTVSVFLGNGDGTFQPHIDYAVGNRPISLVVGDFNGDGALDLAVANQNDGTVTVLLNQNGTGTVLNLQSSASPSSFGQAITLTATIHASNKGEPNPTGSVNFLDGKTALSNTPLNASGVATFTTATLTGGGHTLSAAYSGDSNFASHTVTLMQTVLGEVVTDFGLSSNPGSATVPSGTSADFSVTATALNGFSSAVSLTCSVSPAPSLAPTCALNPTSVTPSAATPATAKLTVSTTASTAAIAPPELRHDWRWLYALWLPVSGLALLGVSMVSPRPRKRATRWLVVCLWFAGLGLQAACGGGGGGGGGGSAGTPSGKYTITVKATSGSISHTVSVAVTVQ